MGEPTGIAWYLPSEEDARFTRLYERHHRSIRDFCRRRVAGDLVDDAVAETFLAAWRQLPDVPSGDEALLWLYRVAYRVVGHQWRSSARRRRLDDRLVSAPPRPAPAADDALVDVDECRRVLEAASHLAATDAEVLRLMAWEQLSIADIASVLDIAANAVKQRLHRARRNLAREYRALDERPIGPPHPERGRIP